ncbi:MAG: hypothetical protein ACR2FG_15930 [Marmoricola sp.]
MKIPRDLPICLVGVLTTLYSVGIAVAPRALAAPTGLLDGTGSVPLPVAQLTRSIGTRDAALAVAMVLAPSGYPLTLLTVARVVSDGADAIWFAKLVDDRAAMLKVCGAAAGWAVLEAAAGSYAAGRLGPKRAPRLRVLRER